MDELFNSPLNYEAAKQPVKLFLPKRLKQLRGFHLLTQNEGAPVLHINRSTYSYYETGKNQPEIETLMKLARFYSVSVDFLLGMDKAA